MAKVGVKSRSIAYWKAGRPMTPALAKKIEQITGVPRHELRPDLWDPPAALAKVASEGEAA